MFIWNDEPQKKSRIEIIPMIDVMMFLLVFFVLISLHVIPAQGFKTELPGASQPEKIEIRQHSIITIASDGKIQLDGVLYSYVDLKNALITLHSKNPKVDIVINSDRKVDVQQLVTVMDAVKVSGISSMALATEKK
ncbi:MAG: hypothetical protein B7Z60_05920 [Ferrovum sp. 37-45-19]|jgi:biopolymer transport protein ExbD|nr:MAG: hypothetical protein B7Z65_06075 [Ferrovum sp. 21-44-67]OYV94263.1 MAG: hypothetical protein B7Z60_05920 [Ferrovum sp. 37-45-19]OZB31707.1 MAG: hypothetical protein B7X47_08600 [Ferrovum sp. 34-44-207]HQT81736.1 biopolymer transporter ExbD [Ferrovaceae bacterium]HQU07038.1 biopolymer transporter ExbD [Ferrovaceae bacterium]